MRNILLRLAYDGTNYHGFQRQPEEHGQTIQGELEKVWKKLFAEEIKINNSRQDGYWCTRCRPSD